LVYSQGYKGLKAMKTLVFLLPLIGGFTGWLTTYIILKLLFWPTQPMQLPFLQSTVQGLIPQKRNELAGNIKLVIETQVMSAVTNETGIAPEILKNFTDTVVKTARERVSKRLPGILPGGIKEKITRVVEDIIRREIPLFVENLADNLSHQKESGPDFCCWAEETIITYDLKGLEVKIMKSDEVRLVKTAAIIMGILSGAVQALLVWIVMA
jgi:hypothetical protein